ncbi:hypothetical protein EVAR_100022_1 [Eumeta japonica]|uniref:Endonuclease/exonuclease/phosphatase domain-containing protein n=1 Tax=Eumeta variegata TaxID=151549 RepID=A0A4C1ZPB5_EUMVA|nr:hypothetical protein EVAR_100022_1 [Eumeta japonica]
MSKLFEERKFWADVRDILVKCDRNERMVVLGDFNGWGRQTGRTLVKNGTPGCIIDCNISIARSWPVLIQSLKDNNQGGGARDPC